MPNTYEPRNPPVVNDEELRTVVTWLYEELQTIANRNQPQLDSLLVETTVLPTKPVVGELRLFGTTYNPGGGVGMYEYTGGGTNGWRMLASGTQY